MITFLRGQLIEALPTQVSVEVQGVGYEVLIPLSSYDKLPPIGRELKLLTHLVVRDDAHVLYGFMTSAERELFRVLTHTVSGIGPKIALNVLSGMSVEQFRTAVSEGDVQGLARISGIGKKTAERMVVELKDKMGTVGGASAVSGLPSGMGADPRVNDALQGLMALGYKQNEARDAVRAALKEVPEEAKVEEVVRACLKRGR